MRALVFHGPGDKSWDEVPEPKIDDDEDVIVQVDAVTICGTDLHILKGDVPEVTPGRVLGRHVAPSAVAPVAVTGTLLVANAILIESALSFLGFGIPPPAATWGGMLHSAQVHLTEAPWLGVFPGMAIVLAVAGVNFLGDGLREALDPRHRVSGAGGQRHRSGKE